MRKTILEKLLPWLPLLFGLCSISAFEMPEEKRFLGRKVADIELRDAKGRHYTLYSLLEAGRPVVLSPVYTRCPMACSLISGGLRKAVDALGTLGQDFTIVTFSFDSTDVQKDLEGFEDRWDMDGETWRTTTATGADIAGLLSSIDYHYEYDSVTTEYLHPNIVIVLTPSGRISRYLYGLEPRAKDLRLAVMEAAKEQSGVGFVQGFYLKCFYFDPATKQYQLEWRFIISTSAGLLILTLMGYFLFKYFFFEDSAPTPEKV
ncbi:MAG: SCO family protein [Haliscomenobacteraceae bacterium CHB4]|nr:hypothetical protein [Saprospiraceae bacterium]MCE7924561.1 SCO family protein [Haliscomenobacteraceae bacterium CHB4]